MASSTAGTDRARTLQTKSSEAATVSGVCGVLGLLAWFGVAIGWSGTPHGEHVGGGVVVLAVGALVLTLLMAAFAAAAYVLGSLAEVEPIR
ncbi:MAG TPA: hypothetical protein VFL59_01065 [Candidatus Nanopelagicales bacterium]|nr:hypothetical protein [Candidatus Nanopelagicales bacterium]